MQGKRSITADTALRLGRFFRMEAQFWLNLQARYDLLQAQHALTSRLEKEVHPYERAAWRTLAAKEGQLTPGAAQNIGEASAEPINTVQGHRLSRHAR